MAPEADESHGSNDPPARSQRDWITTIRLELPALSGAYSVTGQRHSGRVKPSLQDKRESTHKSRRWVV